MEEKDDQYSVALKGSVAVWAFITTLLWCVFVALFIMASLGSVYWTAPLVPFLLAVLSSASNPLGRLDRERREKALKK